METQDALGEEPQLRTRVGLRAKYLSVPPVSIRQRGKGWGWGRYGGGGGTEGRRKEESWKEVKGVGTNQTQEAWLY